MKEVRLGDMVLDHLAVGYETEFEAYEAGKRGPAAYAPVMLGFDDVSSPKRENEQGATYYEKTDRVLPTAYRVSVNEIVFVGKSDTLGKVTFSGELDAEALKKAKASLSHASAGPVLIGTLTIGGHVFRHVALSWFGGD
jgi:hypothetical protein